MTNLTFHILDVFTEKKYAGNQLAVFRQAGGLSSKEMQEIAREVNFSETTFILADEPRNGGFDVRIFTPKEEVPFAGHPTLGTAYIIHKYITQGKSRDVNLNLKVGQIPVNINPAGICWMKQLPPEFGQIHPPEKLAGMLGLQPSDMDGRFPVQEVSTGLPFFVVPLKNLAALKIARVDKTSYFDFIQGTQAKGILVFCPETHESGNHISVRVFVDYYGVPEDPATGSGNGCLAGYLVRYKYFGQDAIDIRAEQGYEISRPSLLFLKAKQAGEDVEVFVGGNCAVVACGEWGE